MAKSREYLKHCGWVFRQWTEVWNLRRVEKWEGRVRVANEIARELRDTLRQRPTRTEPKPTAPPPPPVVDNSPSRSSKDCVLNEFNSAACEKWNYECLEGTRPAAAVLAVTSMATQNFCQACFGPKGSERWAVAAACRECMIGLQQNGVPIGALAISVAACCEKGPLADLDL